MTLTRRRLTAGWHNMTEGPVTTEDRKMALLGACEINRDLLRTGLPDRYRLWLPHRDPHQAIAWDPHRFHVTKTGYLRFHDSGQAEGWPFPTPGRGLTWVEGHHVDLSEVLIVFGQMWWLNSWMPVKADKMTARRRAVVETTTIPKVEDWIARREAAGRAVLIGGDTNSLRWDGDLEGLRQMQPPRRLDRAWVSRDPGQVRQVGDTWEGPKTGKGTQMRHHSLHARIEVRTRRAR